jgi:uncharacterized protein YbjT (DUF2867 family)
MARWKSPRGYVEDVATAIALAVLDEPAAGRISNFSGPVAFSEAEWVMKIGEVVGRRGKIPGAVARMSSGRHDLAARSPSR